MSGFLKCQNQYLQFFIIHSIVFIVLSTYKEPVPGWTDNLYGPSGLCVAVARGYAHVMFGRGNRRANLVPADYCVNALIATAWDINRRYAIYTFNGYRLSNFLISEYLYIFHIIGLRKD